MKHTKGKWQLNEATIINPSSDSKKGDITTIAQCYAGFNYETTTEECLANAKLMSASPELLEACIWAKEQFKRLADEGRYPFLLQGNGLMKLIGAINLATGEKSFLVDDISLGAQPVCVHPYADVMQDENGLLCTKCNTKLTD